MAQFSNSDLGIKIFPNNFSQQIQGRNDVIHYEGYAPVYGDRMRKGELPVPDFQGNHPAEFFVRQDERMSENQNGNTIYTHQAGSTIVAKHTTTPKIGDAQHNIHAASTDEPDRETPHIDRDTPQTERDTPHSANDDLDTTDHTSEAPHTKEEGNHERSHSEEHDHAAPHESRTSLNEDEQQSTENHEEGPHYASHDVSQADQGGETGENGEPSGDSGEKSGESSAQGAKNHEPQSLVEETYTAVKETHTAVEKTHTAVEEIHTETHTTAEQSQTKAEESPIVEHLTDKWENHHGEVEHTEIIQASLKNRETPKSPPNTPQDRSRSSSKDELTHKPDTETTITMVQKEFEFLSVNEKKGETDNFVAVQEVQVEVHSSSGSVSGSADEQRPASGADDHAEVKAELLSELKRIDGVQSLPALKDEAKRRLKQKEDQVAKDIENVKRDYTAAKFLDEVPKHTIKNGKQIDTPDWQRQILAKKRAHEAAIAEEKRLLEELEDWKTQQLPNWRRRTISKDGKDAQVES